MGAGLPRVFETALDRADRRAGQQGSWMRRAPRRCKHGRNDRFHRSAGIAAGPGRRSSDRNRPAALPRGVPKAEHATARISMTSGCPLCRRAPNWWRKPFRRPTPCRGSASRAKFRAEMTQPDRRQDPRPAGRAVTTGRISSVGCYCEGRIPAATRGILRELLGRTGCQPCAADGRFRGAT